MYGTVASLFSPLLYSVAVTYIRPDNYDWSRFKEQRLAVEPDESSSGSDTPQGKGPEQVTTTETASNETFDDNDQRRWTKYALWWAIATFLGHWVLWPLPMYAAKFIFSKEASLSSSFTLESSIFSNFFPIEMHCSTTNVRPPVIYRMDCRVSDLALVDSHHGRVLPDMERSRSDSRCYTKHLEVSVMIHQHFPERLVHNRPMALNATTRSKLQPNLLARKSTNRRERILSHGTHITIKLFTHTKYLNFFWIMNDMPSKSPEYGVAEPPLALSIPYSSTLWTRSSF